MVEDWKTYKLKDIVNQERGISYGIVQPGKHDPDGIPILKVNNITNNSFELKSLHRVALKVEKKYQRTRLRGGELLLSLVGSLGNVYQVPESMKGLNVVRALAVLPVLKEFSPNWVKYWLQCSTTQYLLEQIATTSVQKTINLKEVREIEIPFPSKEERESIASILSALDDKIELNLQMNKTLEDMAMALYKHWFVDFGPFQEGTFVDSELGRIPEGWEVKRLDTLVKFSNGYAFKSKQLLKVEEEDCYHVFKMGHILKGGGLKANGTKSWIRKSDCEKLKRYVLKVGDVLMSMTDMKDKMTILGHTALMNENNKYIVNQRVGLLRVNNDFKIGYPFIFMLTNSFDYIERLRNQANSGVQVNLSTSAIKSSKVVVPTPLVNEKFHKITLPYFEQINQNAIENQTLTKLRDTLLPNLISGKVRLKDIEHILAQTL